MTGFNLAPHEFEQVQHAIASGQSYPDIAADWLINSSTVGYHARRLGVRKAKRWCERRWLNPDERIEIAWQLLAGQPHQAIADRYGMRRDYVTTVAKQMRRHSKVDEQ